jgi:NhaP-type Na+/H+ or K+/H+ antiporter
VPNELTRPARIAFLLVFLLLWRPFAAAGQEPPYFVTYAHYLEEPGNLEISVASTTGVPRGAGSVYTAPWLELEYGVTGWWTTERCLSV